LNGAGAAAVAAVGEWLARDGVWRSFETEPPQWHGEVVGVRDEEIPAT